MERNLEKCGMDFRQLKTAAEKLQRPEDIARCYFAYVHGNTLFVDTSSSRYLTHFWSCLGDISFIDKMGQGAACLAYL